MRERRQAVWWGGALTIALALGTLAVLSRPQAELVDRPVVSIASAPAAGVEAGKSEKVPAENSAPDAEPAMSPRWSIVGNAVREDGAPIPGAKAILRIEEGEVVGTAACGPDGGFTIPGIATKGKLELDLTAPGAAARFLGGELPDLEKAGDRRPVLVDLGRLILAEALELVIKVRGPEGTPVEGAKVVLKPDLNFTAFPDGYWHERPRSIEPAGERGVYRLESPPPGKHRLAVEAAGYLPFKLMVSLPRTDPLMIELEQGLEIAGVVLTQDGRPVSGAKVSVALREAGKFLRREVVTGEDGGFQAEDLPEDLFEVVALADHYAPAKEEEVPAGTLDLVLHLEPRPAPTVKQPATADPEPEKSSSPEAPPPPAKETAKGAVRLLVVDPAGRPLAGVRVSTGWSWLLRSWRGDREGGVLIDDLGRQDLTVRAPGYCEAEIEVIVKEGPVGEERIVLTPAGAIAGRVLVGDVPASNAYVKAVRVEEPPDPTATSMPAGETIAASDETDDQGRFLLEGLCGGVYRVSAKLQHSVPRWKVEVSVESGRTTEAGDLQLGGEEISGRVLDQEGNPVPGAWVKIFLNSDRHEPGTLSGPDGSFRLADLPPREHYLRVEKPGYSFRPVTVKAPASNLELVLRKLHPVAGRVVDADSGEPIPGTKVLHCSDDDAGRCFWSGGAAGSAVTDSEGKILFGVENRRGEIGCLVVKAKGYALGFARVEERAGAPEAVIRLRRGFDYRPRVVDESGHALGEVEACLADATAGFYRAQFKSAADGTIHFPDTTEGSYLLLLRHALHGVEVAPVDARAAGPPPVVVLGGSGRLTVNVRQGGSPPPKAWLELTDEKGVDALGLVHAFVHSEGYVMSFVPNGSRTYTHLPRGRYRLQARVGESVSTPVEVDLAREPVEAVLNVP